MKHNFIHQFEMYATEGAGLVQSKPTELQQINDRFKNLISEAGELTSSIQNKLHWILDRNSPSEGIDPKEDSHQDKIAKSFVPAMNDEAEKLNLLNEDLRKIVNHLNDII